MSLEYTIQDRKSELKGQWKAEYNRTNDDFYPDNEDSKVLFEMNVRLAEELDRLKEELSELKSKLVLD
jgi:hypothetical protein